MITKLDISLELLSSKSELILSTYIYAWFQRHRTYVINTQEKWRSRRFG